MIGYLVDGTVPDDGATCPFVDGIATDAELGDYLFEYPPDWVEGPILRRCSSPRGWTRTAAGCVAGELSGDDHRVVTHVLLGVDRRRRAPTAAAPPAPTAGC